MYARRKAGQEAVTFADPRLEEITGSTYAICIYQEQYMEIAKQLAGFSPAEADDLRKAIGKKIHSLMASLKDKFVEGAIANGLAPDVARGLWSDMEKAQDYSFNKSHAACYALIAYRTAYLKAHHTAHYMAALISSVMNTKDRVPYYVNACDEMGIEVLPPDVNASQVDFAVVEGKIRFGLNAVKNVGEAAAQAIVAGREAEGPFVLALGLHRARRPAAREQARARVAREGGRARLDRQARARACSTSSSTRSRTARRSRPTARRARRRSSTTCRTRLTRRRRRRIRRSPPAEFEKAELLRLEKEALGLYVSEHPLHAIRDQLRRKADSRVADLERRRDGEIVTVGGIVSSVKQLTTKKGDPMVFLSLDDLTGEAEVVVFNSVFAASRELCHADTVLVVKGRVDHKQEGETKLIALEVTAFEAARTPTEVRLKVDARAARAGIVRELGHVVKDFPGDARVVVALETSEGSRTLELGPEYRVRPEADFFAEVKALLGEAAVS